MNKQLMRQQMTLNSTSIQTQQQEMIVFDWQFHLLSVVLYVVYALFTEAVLSETFPIA